MTATVTREAETEHRAYTIGELRRFLAAMELMEVQEDMPIKARVSLGGWLRGLTVDAKAAQKLMDRG